MTILSLNSCSNNSGQQEKGHEIKKPEQSLEQTTDFYRFKHFLPDTSNSGRFYNIEITSINFKENRSYSKIVKEQFGLPEKVEYITISLSLGFKITNPYGKPMNIPFPDKFGIIDKEAYSNKYEYDWTNECYIHNAYKIETLTGKALQSLSQYSERNSEDFLAFEANESKDFLISFEDPIPKGKVLNFIGFNKYLVPHIKGGFYNLDEKEREEYSSKRSKLYSFAIDIGSKKLLSLKEYQLRK